jgi:hypothetical protein
MPTRVRTLLQAGCQCLPPKVTCQPSWLRAGWLAGKGLLSQKFSFRILFYVVAPSDMGFYGKRIFLMKVVKTERSTLYFMSYRYKIYFGRRRPSRSGVVMLNVIHFFLVIIHLIFGKIHFLPFPGL